MADYLQKKYGSKIPWIFGKYIRIPRANFTLYSNSNVSLPNPSRNLLLILIYMILYFFICGGVYLYIQSKTGDLIIGGMRDGKMVFLWDEINQAFLYESLVAGILVYLAGFGFLLIFRSIYHQYDYKFAIKLFLIGLIFIFIATVILQRMIYIKDPTNR